MRGRIREIQKPGVHLARLEGEPLHRAGREVLGQRLLVHGVRQAPVRRPVGFVEIKVGTVIAGRHPEKLLKALMPGHEGLHLAQMPFAHHRGAIASVPQHFGDGDFL